MSARKARKRMNDLDKQGWRKLARLALAKARNPLKYKIEGKGYRTKYFKKLASAAKWYHTLKKNNARPRITSLLFNCSVWTSLQVLDLRALKMKTPAGPSKQMRPARPARIAPSNVPNTLARKKIIEPLYSDEDWNRTFMDGIVRAG